MKLKQVIVSIGLFFSTAIFASETAIFAGGCFWTMQNDFDNVPGVLKTTVGYTGGKTSNPTYEQVEEGNTGHYEAVKIEFDPKMISYKDLVNIYWHNIDPTNNYGQFCDTGNQYRPVIFYSDKMQENTALQSKQDIINSKRFMVVVTQIYPASAFYPAEEYHQEFAKKNPWRYNLYKMGCGRDSRLSTLWAK